MKTFRGKEVIGWKLVESTNQKVFEDAINELMESYDFEDFQFSTTMNDMGITVYTAMILLKTSNPFDAQLGSFGTMSIGLELSDDGTKAKAEV